MGWGAALGGAFGSILNFGSSMSQQQQQNVLAANNERLQREFAQHGIRWKVDDARAAGIHPLFALGASTHSYTPQQVGGSSSVDFSGPLSGIGQAIDRSIAAGQTKDERDIRGHEAAHLHALAVERAGLENDLLRSQIVRSNQQIGPPMPSLSSGGGLTGQQPGVVLSRTLGTHDMKPFEVTTANPHSPGQAAGPVQPSVSWGLTADGSGLQAYPAKIPGLDEVEGPLGLEWYIRNRLVPIVAPGDGPDMGVVRSRWSTAIGVRFDHDSLTWKPVFSSQPRFGARPRPSARDVGVGIRHPMLTSTWRSYK